MTAVTISEKVSYIGEYAFGECVKLEKVNIPDSVTIIDRYAIWKCPNVTIVSAEGSTGQKYAEENGLKWMDLAEWED